MALARMSRAMQSMCISITCDPNSMPISLKQRMVLVVVLARREHYHALLSIAHSLTLLWAAA